MAKSFVSLFKLDGVPLLPPMINDQVRAEVAIYRQQAIEVEQRIQERKKFYPIPREPEPIDPNTTGQPSGQDRSFEEDARAGSLEYHQTRQMHFKESDTTTSQNRTVGEEMQWPEASQPELSQTLTPTKVDKDLLEESPEQMQHKVIWPSNHPAGNTEENDATVTHAVTTTSRTELPSWQTSTRTVTPTSDESLPWFPLVRSNTYNLEKPTIDLHNLQMSQPSNSLDRSKNVVVQKLMPPVAQSSPQTLVEPCSVQQEANGNAAVKPYVVKQQEENNSRPLQRPRRKSSSRSTTICSTASGASTNGSIAISHMLTPNVSHMLTAHKQRMLELLKRQEEERLLLEKSFREKTKEVVALCAKPLTHERTEIIVPEPPKMHAKTPLINTASSVSQLSLCDISFDSCADTDDGAYHTCQADGTSEEDRELLENVNVCDDFHIISTDPNQPNYGAVPPPNKLRYTDANGNDQLFTKQQQEHQAATIINAYARGYLTRRLFKTEEVQSIKRTIVDIVCFIVQSRSRQASGKANDASVRRSAGKQITLCLDRMHEIFIDYSKSKRMQMISRDRLLKKNTPLPLC